MNHEIGWWATNRSSQAIEAYATKNAMTTPTTATPTPMSPPNASLSSKSPAASSAGIDMKKLSLVAVTRSSPRNRPTEIVAPERETPGISATAWPSPMLTASRMLRSRSWRSWRATRSAAYITALQAISAIAITHIDRKGPVMSPLASTPTTPTGMVATMTYQPIRWSSWPRYSDLNRPRHQALMMFQMSLAK